MSDKQQRGWKSSTEHQGPANCSSKIEDPGPVKVPDDTQDDTDHTKQHRANDLEGEQLNPGLRW